MHTNNAYNLTLRNNIIFSPTRIIKETSPGLGWNGKLQAEVYLPFPSV
jgi:hypothetical protein